MTVIDDQGLEKNWQMPIIKWANDNYYYGRTLQPMPVPEHEKAAETYLCDHLTPIPGDKVDAYDYHGKEFIQMQYVSYKNPQDSSRCRGDFLYNLYYGDYYNKQMARRWHHFLVKSGFDVIESEEELQKKAECERSIYSYQEGYEHFDCTEYFREVDKTKMRKQKLDEPAKKYAKISLDNAEHTSQIMEIENKNTSSIDSAASTTAVAGDKDDEKTIDNTHGYWLRSMSITKTANVIK